MNLYQVNRVRFHHIESTLNRAVEDGELSEKRASELLAMMKNAMKIKPSPFFHASAVLSTRGYHGLVGEILSKV